MARDNPERPPLPVRGVAGDPFSRDWGRLLEIRLNGAVQERVLAFNQELGWVRRMVVDADGKPEVDWQSGSVRQTTVFGRVEVQWNDIDKAQG